MGKKERKRKGSPNGSSVRNGATKTSATTSAVSLPPPPPPRCPPLQEASLPTPFPPHWPRPPGFLRNVAPYTESYRAAVETAYAGFVVDVDVVAAATEAQLQRTLMGEMRDHFCTDVTQPFGLGSSCSKTFVTRCLVGDPGTTYKYLGLRMFGHPWPAAVQQLKETLTHRVADVHLPALAKQRGATRWAGRGRQSRAGNHCFDVCLINRMTARRNLKRDAVDAALQTTVSWHADSSLEHYSTIAVYQTIVPARNKDTSRQRKEPKVPCSNEWSIALRVAHNSEGPGTSSLQRGAMEEAVVKETPPIAVSLPTNAAYYLLDDFNHHHQHTVLTSGGSPPGATSDDDASSVRYSLTYRLLRESHNVRHMLDRCQRVTAQFHKRGRRIYRSEQLTLTELESDWLRQFYVQGSHHRALLWKTWGDAIQQLWGYWSALEQRTYQVVALLRHAAEGRCLHQEATPTASSKTGHKAARKVRDRRKKAAAILQDVLDREAGSGDGGVSLYECMAALLDDRATMRAQWGQRAADPAFRDLPLEYRPLRFPGQFAVSAILDAAPSAAATREQGRSPMPGAPDELRRLSTALRAYGRAFVSHTASDLPLLLPSEPLETTDGDRDSDDNGGDDDDDDAKPLDWSGWSEFQFGLEMQRPWAGALLEGRKTIETRAYALPPALIGTRIAIIETTGENAGVSALGNRVALAAATGGAEIVGWCTFVAVKRYTSGAEFAADEAAHLVPTASGFAWREGSTAPALYGWVVGACAAAHRGGSAPVSGRRRLRSLFQLPPPSHPSRGADAVEPRRTSDCRQRPRIATVTSAGDSGKKSRAQKKRRF